MFRSTIVAVLVLITLAASTNTASADEHDDVLRVRVERIDFPPTIVADSRDQAIIFDGFVGPPGRFVVVENVTAPFQLIEPGSELRIRQGRILVRVSFAPIRQGIYVDDLVLVREPAVGPNNDTIRVRVTGTGYRIERTVQLSFGRVDLGDSARRAVRVIADLADDETWGTTKALKPPFELLTPNGLIGTGDTLSFVFQYSPIRPGPDRDTIGLIRRGDGKDLDTIEIYLDGAGLAFSDIDEVKFPLTVVGDSVARVRTFRIPPPLRSRYILDHRPEPPFFLLTDRPVPQPPDSTSAKVGIAYMPTAPGQHADSVVLIRRDLLDRPLDTIRIKLSGSAKGLPTRAELEFVGMKVGDTETKPLVIKLLAEPVNVGFTYELRQEEVGPVEGEIVLPTGASKSTVIELEFTAAPTVFAQTEQRFTLVRSNGSGVVDETGIRVSVSMAPRPLSVVMAWSADTIHHAIGDTAEIDLVLTVIDDQDGPEAIENFVVVVNYNPSVFVPLSQDGQERKVEGDAPQWVITKTEDGLIPINAERTVLATMRGVVVLGDADRSALRIGNTVKFADREPGQVKSRDGLLLVTDIWEHQNGTRLVNSLQGALELSVAPNPVVGASVLKVGNVPQQQGRLIIVDAMGSLHADLTDELRSGQTEWTISRGTETDVSLPAGTFYCRLMVGNNNAAIVNSVVRLIVVQ